MRLFARVGDPELLLRSLNEAGTAFYRVLEGGLVEAVYFSASRCIYFSGGMTGVQLETLRAQAYPVREMRVNSFRGEVEVTQLEG
jgi:hypothetical protein